MVIDIADRIRYLREKCGLTQAALAKQLGISRSAVNAWEMSLTSPSIANIIEMANIFHVSLDYLLTLSDRITVDVTDLTNEEREVVFRLVVELSRYVQSKKSPKSEKPRYLHLFTGVRGVAPNGGKQMRRAAWSGYGRCVRSRPLPVCDRR